MWAGGRGVSYPEGTKILAVDEGVPNTINDSGTTCLTPEDKEVPVTESVKVIMMEVTDDLFSQALCVPVAAVEPMPKVPFDENDEDLSSDNKFKKMRNKGPHVMGLVASNDPERDGRKQAVKEANLGNIRAVTITDNQCMIVKAIAHSIRILKNDEEAREVGNETNDDNDAAMNCGSHRPNGNHLSAKP